MGNCNPQKIGTTKMQNFRSLRQCVEGGSYFLKQNEKTRASN